MNTVHLNTQQLSVMYYQHRLYIKKYGLITFRKFCEIEYKGQFSSYDDGSIYFQNENDCTMFLLKL